MTDWMARLAEQRKKEDQNQFASIKGMLVSRGVKCGVGKTERHVWVNVGKASFFYNFSNGFSGHQRRSPVRIEKGIRSPKDFVDDIVSAISPEVTP